MTINDVRPVADLPLVSVRMPEPAVRERPAMGGNGFLGLLTGVVLVLGVGGGGLAMAAAGLEAIGGALAIVGVPAGALVLRGLTTVAPSEAKVLQFFGRYTGTVRTSGLRWVNPLTSRRKVSTRIRSHESDVLKVNDSDGNPIEIAAVVVWQVADTARAVFEVDSFVEFVHTQTETAVRHIATSYPYDAHDAGLSLRQNAEEITERLSMEISERVESAGVRIVESRLTHLAYAPEIAGAMLQRQQAGAVVAARERIVEGAVGMVDMALVRLSEREIVDLDEERKAAMVSNLLVVLCGDRATQPIVNAGSLYQ
ncbi:SPFH domain-containing protein [Pseudonocardia asaccharolytica]|uniref:Membrane protein n=1 Tax=Pseudonocardia asaccharolytica DSM 44247 = NBRC 16224 TaxID=1123024 RepID=A0A511CWA8_9PSEU|nr:SPFH domain-containing protein [Pseudonocardia asaccharolytica]GEL16850.1 membrane protein [Pseudonocardia asaccharolytica DSM 44247 = NBRC 16224]